MERGNNNILILALMPHLEMGLASRCPFPWFQLGSENYSDLGIGDFIGFYDWLTDPDDRIIGVRQSFFEDIDSFSSMFSTYEYLEWNPKGRVLSVYFSESRTIVESKSGDQDFGDNRIYRSLAGDFAISFALPDSFDALQLALTKTSRLVSPWENNSPRTEI